MFKKLLLSSVLAWSLSMAVAEVNINTASAQELAVALKGTGVGEKRAQDIVAYREANGAFTSVDDLVKVSGIGTKTVAKIKEKGVAGVGEKKNDKTVKKAVNDEGKK